MLVFPIVTLRVTNECQCKTYIQCRNNKDWTYCLLSIVIIVYLKKTLTCESMRHHMIFSTTYIMLSFIQFISLLFYPATLLLTNSCFEICFVRILYLKCKYWIIMCPVEISWNAVRMMSLPYVGSYPSCNDM